MPVTAHNHTRIEEVCSKAIKDSTKKLKKAKEDDNYLVWNKKVPNTELEKFKKIIEEKYDLRF
ncbi:unnamed protein product, partial [Larinioides sclopetarius]